MDESRSENISLVQKLWETYGGDISKLTDLTERMHTVIGLPSNGIAHYSFASMPTAGRANGRMHVSFLNFHPDGFHGKGLYASSDAREQLLIMRDSGFGQSIDVTLSRTDLVMFGWSPDGPIVNSTVALAYIIAALYCVAPGNIPPKVARSCLQQVRAKFQRHKKKHRV